MEPFRRASSDARTLATVSSHRCASVDLGALHAHRAGEHLRRPQQRLLEEVRGLQHDVGDAEVQNLRRLELPVLRHGVVDDDLGGFLGADQVRQQVRPPHPGIRPRNTSGRENAAAPDEIER